MPLLCPNCLGAASVLVAVESMRAGFRADASGIGTRNVTTTQSFAYCPPCGDLAHREPGLRKIRNFFLWGVFWAVLLHLLNMRSGQDFPPEDWVRGGFVVACVLALGAEVWRRRLPMPEGAVERGPAVYCDLWTQSEGATWRARRPEWLDALVGANR